MKIQQKINRLVFVLAITFWVVHAYFDSWLSIEGVSFLESCFNPSAENFLMRGFVVLLLLIFCAYAERLVKIINNMVREAERELEHNQDHLEITVNKHQMEKEEHLVALKELEQLAGTDPLTSLVNRRKFNEILAYEAERTLRHKFNLALVMCDIDNFKRINDSFGHDVGDEALKIFAKKITKNIREIDIFARWGGEEFMILMPNASLDNASSIAEKLRNIIEDTNIKNIDMFTASFGVTNFKVNDTIEAFIKRADDALYKAKKSGRNRVVVTA